MKLEKKTVCSFLTWLAVNLVLRNDDLTRVSIISVLYGMAEDADDPNHLACFAHAVRDVAGVTDQLLASCNLIEKDRPLYIQNKTYYRFPYLSLTINHKYWHLQRHAAFYNTPVLAIISVSATSHHVYMVNKNSYDFHVNVCNTFTSPSDLTPMTWPPSMTISSTGLLSM